jgi:hypothetical protein
MQVSPHTQASTQPDLAPQTLAFQGYDFAWYDKAMAEIVAYEMKKMQAKTEAEFKSYDDMQRIRHDFLMVQVMKAFSDVRKSVRDTGVAQNRVAESSEAVA